MHDGVVRGVEFLPLEALREHRHLAVVLVAHDLARAVLAGDLPALEIEGVAVRVAGRGAEAPRHVAVLLEPAQVLVVGDVAPQEVAADAAPGRPFGPQGAGIEALDRRVAELRLEALVDDDDVRVGIALRRRARLEIAREGVGRHGGDAGQRRRLGEEGAPRWRAQPVGRRRGLLPCGLRAGGCGEIDEAVKL